MFLCHYASYNVRGGWLHLFLFFLSSYVVTLKIFILYLCFLKAYYVSVTASPALLQLYTYTNSKLLVFYEICVLKLS